MPNCLFNIDFSLPDQRQRHIFHPSSTSKAVKLNVQGGREETHYKTLAVARTRGIYHSFVHTLAVAKRERVNFLYDTKKTERELARERSAKICRIKGPFCHALTLQKTGDCIRRDSLDSLFRRACVCARATKANF